MGGSPHFPKPGSLACHLLQPAKQMDHFLFKHCFFPPEAKKQMGCLVLGSRPEGRKRRLPHLPGLPKYCPFRRDEWQSCVFREAWRFSARLTRGGLSRDAACRGGVSLQGRFFGRAPARKRAPRKARGCFGWVLGPRGGGRIGSPLVSLPEAEEESAQASSEGSEARGHLGRWVRVVQMQRQPGQKATHPIFSEAPSLASFSFPLPGNNLLPRAFGAAAIISFLLLLEPATPDLHEKQSEPKNARTS